MTRSPYKCVVTRFISTALKDRKRSFEHPAVGIILEPDMGIIPLDSWSGE